VCDNDTGIPPEIKDKLFQLFFTSTPTGEGTGLGLSISYDTVTQQQSGLPKILLLFSVLLPEQRLRPEHMCVKVLRNVLRQGRF